MLTKKNVFKRILGFALIVALLISGIHIEITQNGIKIGLNKERAYAANPWVTVETHTSTNIVYWTLETAMYDYQIVGSVSHLENIQFKYFQDQMAGFVTIRDVTGTDALNPIIFSETVTKSGTYSLNINGTSCSLTLQKRLKASSQSVKLFSGPDAAEYYYQGTVGISTVTTQDIILNGFSFISSQVTKNTQVYLGVWVNNVSVYSHAYTLPNLQNVYHTLELPNIQIPANSTVKIGLYNNSSFGFGMANGSESSATGTNGLAFSYHSSYISANGNTFENPVNSYGYKLKCNLYYSVKTTPTITVTSPNSGNSIGNSMPLTATINDAGVGEIINVAYNLDGGVTVKLNGPASTGTPQTFNSAIDTSALSVGAHTINVWAEDQSGITSSITTVNFSKHSVKYYDKYNCVSEIQDNAPWELAGTDYIGPGSQVYLGYNYDKITNNYSPQGSTVNNMDNPTGTYHKFDSIYYPELNANRNRLSKYVYKTYNLTTPYYNVYYKHPSKNTKVDIKGTLVQSNIEAAAGTYPSNGKHTDGFWYVDKSLTNSTPAITLSSPIGNQSYGNGLYIAGSVYDTDTGDTLTIRYNIDSGATVSLPGTITSDGNPANFASAEIDVSNLSVGNHTLNAWVIDNKGGMSSVTSITFSKYQVKMYDKYTCTQVIQDNAPWKLELTSTCAENANLSGYFQYLYNASLNRYETYTTWYATPYIHGTTYVLEPYTSEGSLIYSTQIYKYEKDSVSNTGTTTTYRMYRKNASENTLADVKGTLVTADIVAAAGTYPSNGKHTDGYWYVDKSIVNNVPSVSVTSPITASNQKSFITIKGTVTDIDVNDLITLKYDIDGGQVNTIQQTVSSGSAIAFNNTTVNIGGLTPGNHTLNVWAEDNRGGKSVINSITFNKLTMYYYNKYTSISKYCEPTNWTYSGYTQYYPGDASFHTSYSFDQTTGAFSVHGPTYYPGSTPYWLGSISYPDNSWYQLLYKAVWDSSTGASYWVYYLNARDKTLQPDKGTFIETIIEAEGVYPDNGKHTDGYWYEKGAIVNDNPSVTVITPLANTTYSNNPGHNVVTLTGNVIDQNTGDQITTYYKVDDGIEQQVVGTVTSSGSITDTTIDISALTDGNHTLYVWCTDQTGNSSNIHAIAFKIDNTGPTIIINGVEDGQVYDDVILNPIITINDASVISSSSITLNGAEYISGAAIAGSGTHVLGVNATDGVGNTTSSQVTFKLNKLPTYTLSTPDNQWFSAQPGKNILTLEGEMQDLDTGDTLIGLYNFDGGTEVQFVSEVSIGASAPFNHNVNLDGLNEGTHTVEVKIKDDVSNNSNPTLIRTFNIDRTPPEIQIGGVASNGVYLNTATPTINILENNLSSSSITLDGHPYTSGSPITELGNHLLEIYAEDLAGNITTSGITFYINAAPAISVSSHTDNQILNSYNFPTTITGTAIDNNGNESISEIEVIFGNTTKTLTTSGITYDPASGTWSTTFAGNEVGEGVRSLIVRVTDEKGETSQAPTLYITVDISIPDAPTIIRAPDTDINNGDYTLSIAGEINSILQYRMTGAVEQDWTSYSSEVGVTTDGSITFDARVIDAAGNISLLSTVALFSYNTLLTDASTAVNILESNKTQANYDDADAKVSLLPELAPEKSGLLERLSQQSESLQIMNAVNNATNMDNIRAANDMILILDSSNPDSDYLRIYLLNKVKDASLLTVGTDCHYIQNIINLVSEGAEKTALQNHFDTAFASIYISESFTHLNNSVSSLQAQGTVEILLHNLREGCTSELLIEENTLPIVNTTSTGIIALPDLEEGHTYIISLTQKNETNTVLGTSSASITIPDVTPPVILGAYVTDGKLTVLAADNYDLGATPFTFKKATIGTEILNNTVIDNTFSSQVILIGELSVTVTVKADGSISVTVPDEIDLDLIDAAGNITNKTFNITIPHEVLYGSVPDDVAELIEQRDRTWRTPPSTSATPEQQAQASGITLVDATLTDETKIEIIEQLDGISVQDEEVIPNTQNATLSIDLTKTDLYRLAQNSGISNPVYRITVLDKMTRQLVYTATTTEKSLITIPNLADSSQYIIRISLVDGNKELAFKEIEKMTKDATPPTIDKIVVQGDSLNVYASDNNELNNSPYGYIVESPSQTTLSRTIKRARRIASTGSTNYTAGNDTWNSTIWTEKSRLTDLELGTKVKVVVRDANENYTETDVVITGDDTIINSENSSNPLTLYIRDTISIQDIIKDLFEKMNSKYLNDEQATKATLQSLLNELQSNPAFRDLPEVKSLISYMANYDLNKEYIADVLSKLSQMVNDAVYKSKLVRIATLLEKLSSYLPMDITHIDLERFSVTTSDRMIGYIDENGNLIITGTGRLVVSLRDKVTGQIYNYAITVDNNIFDRRIIIQANSMTNLLKTFNNSILRELGKDGTVTFSLADPEVSGITVKDNTRELEIIDNYILKVGTNKGIVRVYATNGKKTTKLYILVFKDLAPQSKANAVTVTTPFTYKAGDIIPIESLVSMRSKFGGPAASDYLVAEVTEGAENVRIEGNKIYALREGFTTIRLIELVNKTSTTIQLRIFGFNAPQLKSSNEKVLSLNKAGILYGYGESTYDITKMATYREVLVLLRRNYLYHSINIGYGSQYIKEALKMNNTMDYELLDMLSKLSISQIKDLFGEEIDFNKAAEKETINRLLKALGVKHKFTGTGNVTKEEMIEFIYMKHKEKMY